MIARRRLALIVALVVWSSSTSAASAQTSLRYKFKEGDTLKYATEKKLKMFRTVMGNVAEVTVDQTSDFTWMIRSVDSQGKAQITVKFGHNKIMMDTPAGKMLVDSKSTEEPDDPTGRILHKVIRGFAGLEVSGTMSPLGEFSDIKVPEEALTALRKMPGSDVMGDLLTPDGLKRVARQSTMLLPMESVSKGSTWKTGKSETKLPFGKSVVEIQGTYDGAVDQGGRTVEKFLLKQKETIESDPKSDIIVRVKSYESTGHAFFDRVAGRLLEAVNQEKSEKEIDINGVTIHERIVQTTASRLVK